MRVEFQSLFEIFLRLLKAAEMSVRQSHESIGTCGWIQLYEFFEFLYSALGLARHEIAFAQGGMKIGALRRNFQPRLKQGNRILKIILRHTESSQQVDHVGVLRRQFVRAHQQLQGIDRP